MQQEDKKILVKFGKKIAKIRKTKSKSLNKFSFERGGVTTATLSRIENGLVDFKFSTLIKLSAALDVPLSEIFEDFNFEYDITDN